MYVSEHWFFLTINCAIPLSNSENHWVSKSACRGKDETSSVKGWLVSSVEGRSAHCFLHEMSFLPHLCLLHSLFLLGPCQVGFRHWCLQRVDEWRRLWGGWEQEARQLPPEDLPQGGGGRYLCSVRSLVPVNPGSLIQFSSSRSSAALKATVVKC